jgi:hypothetical protein
LFCQFSSSSSIRGVSNRVARSYRYFSTKNSYLGIFGSALEYKRLVYFEYFEYYSYNHVVCLWSLGIFCGHLVNFFPVLVPCTKKNLATLVSNRKVRLKKSNSISRHSQTIVDSRQRRNFGARQNLKKNRK